MRVESKYNPVIKRTQSYRFNFPSYTSSRSQTIFKIFINTGIPYNIRKIFYKNYMKYVRI